jgi:hypothetical protein
VALVREEDRPKLLKALAEIGVTPTEGEKLGDLLASAGKADADTEVFVVGPPKKRRALIEQAIANNQSIVIGTVEYNSVRLNKTVLDPIRISGEGAGAALVAKMPGHKYEYEYNMNRIQAVRIYDPPPPKK